MSIKPTSVPPKTLYQSILSSDMTFKLNNIKGWDGVDLTASDFGTDAYGAFLSSDRTQMEIFKWDPSTIANTAITITYRGLKFDGTLLTEIAANKLNWTANETIVMLGADTPQLIASMMEDSQIDTDATLAANSDTRVASQKAIKTYIANVITGIVGVATNLLFGTVKLSTAAANPAAPIAVGDNDTRVPTVNMSTVTADQVAALAGTGTPNGTTGKYVTNDDTSNSGASSKVVRLNGTAYPAGNGAALTNLTPGPRLISTFTAGESLTPGLPVIVLPYSSSAIALDTTDSGYDATAQSSYSDTITVGNNSNRMLIVFAFSHDDVSDTISGITYNGEALTKSVESANAGSSGTNKVSVWYKLNPAVGGNTLTITGSGTLTGCEWAVYSYYNVKQAAPEFTSGNAGSGSGYTMTISPLLNGEIAIGAVGYSTGAAVTGNMNTNNKITVYSTMSTGAGNASYPPAPQLMTVASDTTNRAGVAVSIAPVESSVTPRIYKSSGKQAVTVNSYVGMTETSGNAGDSVTVTTEGLNTYHSGLNIGDQFYLADSSGILATSQGTVARKAGIAVSTTDILITNIW